MVRVPKSWCEVPTEEYLTEALALSDGEEQRLEALSKALPEQISDAHTHLSNSSEVSNYPNDLLTHAVSTFPAYSFEQADSTRRTLWPNKTVHSLRMAHAVRGYDYRAINRTIASRAASEGDVYAAYGLPDDIPYTLNVLEEPHVRALKMYHAYRDPPYERIVEIFPPPVLVKATKLGVPIILHLPRPLPHSTHEVVEVAATYPSLTIVLAHIGGHGGQFLTPGIGAALRQLSASPNVSVDTAFVYDEALISAALSELGPQRVLFGSDEPLSLIRAVVYTHPQLGPRLYAPKYYWARNDHPPNDVASSIPQLLHILQLEASLAACRPLGDIAIDAVFRGNGKRVFDLG